jgi:AcrR family transcriptional regulator
MGDDRSSKERLLAAAWQLAIGAFEVGGEVTRTTPRVFDQLTAARVSQYAGLTTGAFYNRWLDRDAFLVDFLEYALAATRSKAVDEVVHLVEHAEGMTPEELAIEAIKRTVDATMADTAFAMHMYLWALTRSREVVVDHLSAGYVEARENVGVLLSLFLTSAGYELRSPFTVESISVMMVALVEGLALQRSIDPERVNMDVVEQAVIAITQFASQPVTGQQDS